METSQNKEGKDIGRTEGWVSSINKYLISNLFSFYKATIEAENVSILMY